ncbi:MAG: DUF4834 family protein [Bacteroidaceae bacterium]
MKSLGCLFTLLIVVFTFVFFLLGAVSKILASFFGLGRTSNGTKANRQHRASTDRRSKNSSQQTASSTSTKQSTGKVIGDDEGEYVDFEEVK